MRRFIIMERKAKIIEVRSCPGIVNEYVLLPDGAIMPMEIWEELSPPEKPELESLPMGRTLTTNGGSFPVLEQLTAN